MTFYRTVADDAELAVLVDALVEEAWPHRGKPGFREALRDAVNAIVEWKRRRELHSVAAFLRAREDIREWAA